MTSPSITAERLAQIRRAFTEAANLEGEARERFLREHCAGDEDLYREVQNLLAVGGAGQPTVDGGFDGVIAEAAHGLAESIAGQGDVDVVGPYRILQKIGQGGMGRVYLAERDDGHFDQQVAIKIVDQNRLTPELVARFQSERQILASLDHPNIARLFDGGETDKGVPYLVMEYVDGVPVDQYCDDQRLSLPKRLKLFVDICSAVDYAHRRLIVHRDIKPSNIVVTKEGVPKLLDFGIAKLLSRDSIDYTMAVTVGDVRVMTPRNASPEQIRGEAITTASDIYSLGLLLYQLLTGHFPYRASGTQAYELERLICETDPLRPSAAVTRIEQVETGNASPERISNARGVRTADQLQKLLRGDLDNIILVAMRKEPERRYASARQLADDVSNYLELRPVLARGDSLSYRSAKFLRRNLGSVALAGSMAALVGVLITVYTIRLAAERDRAALEASKAREVTEFMTELFREADPRQSFGEPVSVVDMLDRGAERARDELADQPELQASLMSTIGQSYHNMWDLNKTREHLAGFLPEAEARLGDDHPDVLNMRYVLGMAISFQSDYEEALPLHQKNYDILVEKHGRRSAEAALELHQLAFIQLKTLDLEAAEASFLEEIDIFRSLGDDYRSDLGTALMEYGSVLILQERFDEVRPTQQEALELQRAVHGEEHPKYVAVLNNIGNDYMRENKFDEALATMLENRRLNKKIYGEQSIPYAVATGNFAVLTQQLGDNDAALPMFREVLELYRVGYGEDAVRFAYANENLAGALEMAEDYVQAEEYFRKAVDILTRKFGPNHVEAAITAWRLGDMLNRLGRHDEALEIVTDVAATMSGTWGEAHSRTMAARTSVARVLHELGRDDEAIAEVTIALDASAGGPDSLQPRRVRALQMLATIREDSGDTDAALELLGEALAQWEALGLVEQPGLSTMDEDYARLLIANGEREAAVSLVAGHVAEFEAAFGADNRYTKELAALLEELSR